jgi:hypothetical protein
VRSGKVGRGLVRTTLIPTLVHHSSSCRSNRYCKEQKSNFPLHFSSFSSVATLLLFSVAPLLLFSVTPLLLFSVAPILLFSVDPLLSFSTTPILSFSVAPILLFSVDPLLSFSTTPILSFSVAPILLFSVAAGRGTNAVFIYLHSHYQVSMSWSLSAEGAGITCGGPTAHVGCTNHQKAAASQQLAHKCRTCECSHWGHGGVETTKSHDQ